MPIISDIQKIIRHAQRNAILHINKSMLEAYWLVGKRIVEEEQQGESRAAYGKEVMKNLSIQLQKEFGRGFSVDNLQNMRLFYIEYQIPAALLKEGFSDDRVKYETLSRKLEMPDFQLSWSHYLMLIRMSDKDERSFYEIESVKNQWSLRELKRQYDSGVYMRLALSSDKTGANSLAVKGHVIENPKDAIKDPYVLEFLDLSPHFRYTENELENKIIDKLEFFLLELGKGFTFVARQKRISFDERNFYIDLVFFNRMLRCFVLVDLKMGDLKHQDIGQMQMYVNYYDRYVKLDDEHKTIGIILCQDKSETLVEITLPEGNDQIFASRYQTVLPNKEQLKQILEDECRN